MTLHHRWTSLIAATLMTITGWLTASDLVATGQTPESFDEQWDRDRIWQETAAPYRADGIWTGVDTGTLQGKVICGYQGWFTCPGDGAERGWYHWGGRRGFRPGSCSIDLWPDTRELPSAERFPTSFRDADGSPATVYSPLIAATVDRHFSWMKQYQIDGVMVQRFGVEIRSRKGLYHFNRVLQNCRAGANHHGRTWAVMYDLSGLPEGGTQTIREDWIQLVNRMNVGRDPAYLHHQGKPLVALWGIGFSDGRKYSLTECADLVDFLKNDPDYGGNAVMLGVPSQWRTLRGDAMDAPDLHRVIQQADIVSPWSVGRYGDTAGVQRYRESVWSPDQEWCRDRSLAYLPVVFPGFSWHNLHQGRGDRSAPLGQIPRRKGAFLWEQFTAVKAAGAEMVYVAMFDEMDEGTAIFKCSPNPPGGESPFLDFEGLGSDHYLWLTGEGGKLLRGQRPPGEVPQRSAQQSSVSERVGR